MTGPFPCDNTPNQCDTNPNPLTPFSSEAVDSTTFIGLAWGNQMPALNKPFNVFPCEAIAESQVSQTDADIIATNQAVACSNPCAVTFSNTAQTATGTCANGSTYSLTIPAGIFTADNQVLADRKAFTAAAAALRGHSICFGSLAPASVCRGGFYFGIISLVTTDAPADIILISGDVPDGLELIFESDRVVVQGTPLSFGTSNFILRATSSVGVVTQQSYSVSVTGIVTDSALDDGTTGTDYSSQLTAVFPDVAGISWSVTEGTLPDGLNLDSDSGVISGTPTTAAESNFTVGATSGDVTCTKDFSINITSSSDVCTDGVAALLPNTYAIDGYFDGLIDNSLSDPSASPLWDGTFIYSMGDGNPDDGITGWSNGGTVHHFSIQSNKACSAQIQFRGCTDGVPLWRVQVSNIDDAALWRGEKTEGQTPEGVYNLVAGIDPAPLTVTIVKLGGASTPQSGSVNCSS